MFESSSWDPDDRVVFWNLRAKAQEWAFPPAEEWARKEGFGFQSIHGFIYITYFHRSDSFKGRRGLFSDFQCAPAPVFYFPALRPTMRLFPEQRSAEACMGGPCLLLRDTFRVLLKRGDRNGRLHDCLASPVFQRGPKLGRNCSKNNGTWALEQLFDENCSPHTAETSSLFDEIGPCFLQLFGSSHRQ